MDNNYLIMIANRDCPGHQHKVVEVMIKHGEWDNKTNSYVKNNNVNSTFGSAKMECLK